MIGEDIDKCYTRYIQVSCLYGLADIELECAKLKNSCKISSESHLFLLHQLIKKLGVKNVRSLVNKLFQKGLLNFKEGDAFEVEHVLDHVEEDGETFYLIKWKNWSVQHNTWEPKENVTTPGLLEAYHKAIDDLEKAKSKRPSKARKRKRDDSKPKPVVTETKEDKIEDIIETLEQCEETLTAYDLLKLASTEAEFSKLVSKGLLSGTPGTTPVYRQKKGKQPTHEKRGKTYKFTKAEAHKALKEWEKLINIANKDPASIAVENNVDLEGPPENFEYIHDYVPGEGVNIPNDPLIGCECEDCWDNRKDCCPTASGSEFVYSKGQRVRCLAGTPIYECNKRCKCGPDCPNRVVQHGRKYKVCVFKTSNGRGWGVKTLQRIKKGSFVMEYVGEVISTEEAENRGKTYDAEGRTYLFDLDYDGGDCPYTVDARFHGNVSHFVNHSCDPNLEVFGVWINTLDARLPRIALFAKKDIGKGEELTFDYLMKVGEQMDSDPETAPSPRKKAKLEHEGSFAKSDDECLATLIEKTPVKSASIEEDKSDNKDDAKSEDKEEKKTDDKEDAKVSNDTKETKDVEMEVDDKEKDSKDKEINNEQAKENDMVKGKEIVENGDHGETETKVVESETKTLLKEGNSKDEHGESLKDNGSGDNKGNATSQNDVVNSGDGDSKTNGEKEVKKMDESFMSDSDIFDDKTKEKSVDTGSDKKIDTDSQNNVDDKDKEEVKETDENKSESPSLNKTPTNASKIKRASPASPAMLNSPIPPPQYRMKCQCGAKKCRGYLF